VKFSYKKKKKGMYKLNQCMIEITKHWNVAFKSLIRKAPNYGVSMKQEKAKRINIYNVKNKDQVIGSDKARVQNKPSYKPFSNSLHIAQSIAERNRLENAINIAV
jgi:hypothetical protein